MDFPQAGGHGLMVKVPTTVMKPTHPSEVWFYINIHPVLRQFMATFYMAFPVMYAAPLFSPDKLAKIVQKGYTDVLMMESLSRRDDEFGLDIKLGSVHWRGDASTELIESHKKRNEQSLTTTHKFRLDGVFQTSVYSLAKDETRNFSIDQLNSAFMCISDTTKRSLMAWIARLIGVLSHFQISIYGPSILISGSNKNPKFTLIDFTVYEIGGVNQDLIEGLTSFQQFLINHIEFCKPPVLPPLDLDLDSLE